MEDPANEANENASNEAKQQEGIVKVWKFDLNLSFIKSIFGIFTIALVVSYFTSIYTYKSYQSN
jgi:hypothetical protein